MTRTRNQYHASHKPARAPRLGTRTPSNVAANRAAMRALSGVLGRAFAMRASK